MSESVQRDDHRSSFHDMLQFRYDEHRPALHVEGLREEIEIEIHPQQLEHGGQILLKQIMGVPHPF
jgi:hypothetical protein